MTDRIRWRLLQCALAFGVGVRVARYVVGMVWIAAANDLEARRARRR